MDRAPPCPLPARAARLRPQRTLPIGLVGKGVIERARLSDRKGADGIGAGADKLDADTVPTGRCMPSCEAR